MGADEAILEAPVARRLPDPAPKATVSVSVPAPRPVVALSPTLGEAASLAAAASSLEELREAMAGFTGSSLRDTATNLVFSDGVVGAGTMIIGEAPGAEEDRQGKPFVGASGQLLDRMFATIGLSRSENLYITNILPFRPPGNRTPTDAEVALFMPFLMRHLELARPKRLVLAGAVSAKGLLRTRDGITRLRGKWQQVTMANGQVMDALPMLHPAYLLRNPIAKREAWADLVLLRRAINDG
ncbi:uracil-DNA glycosylase [Roseococcus sp. YIM B11640]|uniref:uracil-DNA glycosylase n=1 Tax=Roseococcus sp. YIM B11640 TaxID=3133973 RepID=UPI003C7ED297